MVSRNDEWQWFEHEPVLLDACVSNLIQNPNGIYVDATLGGAGHSKEILRRLGPEAELIGLDQDEQALKIASERLGNDSRFKAIQGNFAHIQTLLGSTYEYKLDGLFLDLGVSTHQLKAAERGFSHKHDGPLDMRMSPFSTLKAQQILNEYDREQLAYLIFHYGEERLSRPIADAIVNSRPLDSTKDLKAAVESVVKGRFVHKSVARVFQAIRIEVNQELNVIEQVLEQSVHLLKPGGRLCVLSYHSLEDRMIKRFLKTGNIDGVEKKDLFGNIKRPFEPLNTKVITPDSYEIQRNKAARSAKLRIGVKLSHLDS